MTRYKYSVTSHNSFFVYVLLAFSLLSVQGCATQGYTDVDTARKAILVATAEVRNANKLLQDLIARNAITDESASKALLTLRRAHENLQNSLRAIDVAGDPLLAEDFLAKANISISLALALLAQFTE